MTISSGYAGKTLTRISKLTMFVKKYTPLPLREGCLRHDNLIKDLLLG